MTGNVTPLQYAIRENNLELVKLLVPRTKDINCQNKGGFTAIHLATKSLKIFKYLMCYYGSKINPNITEAKFERLPLHMICDEPLGNVEDKIEMVKALIPLTLDTDQKDGFNKTPLDYAREKGFKEIVKILWNKSMDNFLTKVCHNPNNPDINGRLPIHEICMKNSLNFELNMNGRIELSKTLIILTANINHRDKFGNTALHYAVENEYSELVKILAKKCDPLIKNENGYAPIDLAILHNNVDIVKILAPETTFQFGGVLQRPKVQDDSWEFIKMLNDVTRKRKICGPVNSLKRAKYQ